MGKKLSPRLPPKPIQLEVEYIRLSEREDNERIERLTRKILRILENPGEQSGSDETQEPAHEPKRGIEEIFDTSLEKAIGL